MPRYCKDESDGDTVCGRISTAGSGRIEVNECDRERSAGRPETDSIWDEVLAGPTPLVMRCTSDGHTVHDGYTEHKGESSE